MSDKVVVITGASSGMGFEAAKLFSEKGWKVFAGARRVEKIPPNNNVTGLKLDVTDSASNQDFISEILKKTSRIDVLINNAGYGEFGPAEEVPMASVRRQFDTNFFGVVELTQLVLPTMRRQQSGRIINVSSVVGDIYLPFGAYYNASKAALNQWSNVLDIEISQFGLRSIVVQPGDTLSSFQQIIFENASKNTDDGSVYQPLLRMVKSVQHRPFAVVAEPKSLAKLFYRVAAARKLRSRYFNSLMDRELVRLARSHPQIYKKIVSYFVNQHLGGYK